MSLQQPRIKRKRRKQLLFLVVIFRGFSTRQQHISQGSPTTIFQLRGWLFKKKVSHGTDIMVKKIPFRNIETIAYFVLWISSVTYAIYHVYLASKIYDSIGGSDDLSSGWSLLRRKKDVADYEWRIWIPFIYNSAPWAVIHLCLAEFTRLVLIEAIPICYLMVTTLFLLSHFNVYSVAMLYALIVLYFIVMHLRSRACIWLTSAAVFISNPLSQIHNTDDASAFLLFPTYAWLHLRCLSFSLDHVDTPQSEILQEGLNLIAYTCYFPTFCLGPHITYDQFRLGLYLPSSGWPWHRWQCLLLRLCRCTGWLLFTDWALHYVYCNALQHQIEVVVQLGLWTLNGLGYCIGQFFQLKYIVVYGLTGAVASAERYYVPPLPKCIARIYLYSDMWRHFDHGFYNFLIRYIYLPVCGKERILKRKLWASFLSFSFVFVWHGIFLSIFLWSALNFLGVSVEAVCKNISEKDSYIAWQKRYLNAANARRFKALIASPLFAMSAISNFFFFGGLSVGSAFANQFTQGTIALLATTLLFSYCMSQVSIEISLWEKHKKHE